MIGRLVVIGGLAVAGAAHAESKPPAAAPFTVMPAPLKLAM